MAAKEGGIRFDDPHNIKESLAMGPCIVAVHEEMTEIIFTNPRYDIEVLAGQRTGEPTLIIVGRIMMHTEGAAALAGLISQTIRDYKTKAGRVIPDSQGGHA